MAKAHLDRRAEDEQKKHVARQMKHAAVNKQRGHQVQHRMSGGNRGIAPSAAILAGLIPKRTIRPSDPAPSRIS